MIDQPTRRQPALLSPWFRVPLALLVWSAIGALLWASPRTTGRPDEQSADRGPRLAQSGVGNSGLVRDGRISVSGAEIAPNAPLARTGNTSIRREGTRLEQKVGYFRETGDRISFFSADGETTFTVLENLNLQRVADAIEGNLDRVDWVITGVVTEYRNQNYLLLETVVLTRGRGPGARVPKRGESNPRPWPE